MPSYTRRHCSVSWILSYCSPQIGEHPALCLILINFYCYDIAMMFKIKLKRKNIWFTYIYIKFKHIFAQKSFWYRFLDTALYLFSQLHLCSVYTRELLTYRVIIFKYILSFSFLKSVFSHISDIYHYCFAEKLGGMSTGQEIN